MAGAAKPKPGKTREPSEAPASKEEVVDVALVSTRLVEGETPSDSLAYRAKLWITQDRQLKRIHDITTPHDFFDRLRRSAGPGRKIGRLLIVAHGREHDDEQPYIDLDPPLNANVLDLEAIQSNQEAARQEIRDCETKIKDLTSRLPRMKTKSDREKIEQMIRIAQDNLTGQKDTLTILSEREQDILSIRDVMAPGGQVFLINCRTANSPTDAGPLVKRLGRILLRQNGGRITAATGPVQVNTGSKDTTEGRDTMNALLLPLTAFTGLADFLRFVREYLTINCGSYQYIGLSEGAWMREEVNSRPNAGLKLGRLFMTGDTFRIPAGPTGQPATVKELTQFLMSGSGSFKPMNYGPAGSTGPVPDSVDCGSATVPGAGVIRYRIQANPPSPGGWTVYNSNANLELRFTAGVSVSSASTGPWMGTTTEGNIPVAGPCSVHVVLTPPHSHGYNGGAYPIQIASFQLEFVANDGKSPASYGEIVQNGDQIATGNAKALLYLAEGTRILLRRDTQLRLVTTKDGALRAMVEGGSVYVVKRPWPGRKLEFRFGPRVVKPSGTAVNAYVGEREGYVQVEEGALEVESTTGTTPVEAGQELDLFTGEIGPIEPRYGDDKDFDGWPLVALPLDTEPVPPVHLEGGFAKAGDLAGWMWLTQQPGPDSPQDTWKIEQGALTVATSFQTTFNRGAPRLWRKLTDDFDVAMRLSIQTHPDDHVWTRFFVFAAGSGIGRNIGATSGNIGLTVDTVMLPGLSCVKGRYSVSVDPTSPTVDATKPPEPLPVWLCLSRRDRRLIVSSSADAMSWMAVQDSVFTELPDTLWVGLTFEHEPEDAFTRRETGNTTTIVEQRIISAAKGTLPNPV